jgi:hypothetical protein
MRLQTSDAHGCSGKLNATCNGKTDWKNRRQVFKKNEGLRNSICILGNAQIE